MLSQHIIQTINIPYWMYSNTCSGSFCVSAESARHITLPTKMYSNHAARSGYTLSHTKEFNYYILIGNTLVYPNCIVNTVEQVSGSQWQCVPVSMVAIRLEKQGHSI